MEMFSMRQITDCLTVPVTHTADTLKYLEHSKNYRQEMLDTGMDWLWILIEAKLRHLVLSLVGMTLTGHIVGTLE